jgi:ribosomal protein S27AE
MTSATIQTRRRRGRRVECERPVGEDRGTGTPTAERSRSLFDDVGGEPTLDALVSGVWEGLAAHQHAACPLCGGEMVAAHGAHARSAAGRCGDCGTTLE